MMNNNLTKDILKIPNFFTLLNTLCGFFSVLYAIEDNYSLSGILILFGMLFDFLDGFSARLLNQQSEIGKQFDSFADMITFGLAPCILVYASNYENVSIIYKSSIIIFFISIIFRLSKYNMDTVKQSDVFLGLPSTYSGGFIAFLIIWFPIIFNYQISFLIFILLAVISVSNIPYNKIRINNFRHVSIIVILFILYLIFKKNLILILFILYLLSGFFNLILNFINKMKLKNNKTA